ncbi:mono-functional DNA-alkylating methyl methanesulfonate N-term-domain-containing protein [Calycina marina]|uniref:Mono-functional DNA-alkylating methyl methanesulfonate N-term-domain-containing protein n=1 Tax=Calycina marina TaxID=1763456 RepID=A0A9P7Z0M0_9HELO|nr:mono-functional DNA-alkylating methyl methanesulfonate N-term-domain-containing protein [Calycina marina]
MAFAANQFLDGQWTTRTVNVNDVLKHYDEQDNANLTAAPDIQTVPTLGLLSQTVIKSPLAHWILPARLRHLDLNDVAFIGESFIQIKELRQDGHLWDVAIKYEFGQRIRNACVVGSLKESKNPTSGRRDSADSHSTAHDSKDGDADGDIDMDSSPVSPENRTQLPPQMIFLQLVNLTTVLLFLEQDKDGEWVFFTSTRYKVDRDGMETHQPGTHLAVDPSSRFLAIGTREEKFAVLRLTSRKDLEKQHARWQDLEPIKQEAWHEVPGTIHKMEFLYPAADDEDHIILLVLAVYKGRTRMLVYEWAAGTDIHKSILRSSEKGHKLAEIHHIPLILVPLKVKSSFILISEQSIAVCKDLLVGQPTWDEIETDTDEPTSLHHGLGNPLWTAWTRPPRSTGYFVESHDCIYISREDGLIKCLEIHSDDEIIKAELNIGILQTNCGTALASLEYIHPRSGDTSGDYLIAGGDSGLGAAYLIKARKPPVFQQHIPNWSPASDFVTTSLYQDSDVAEPIVSRRKQEKIRFEPDQIYACIGKGSNGAILEYRQGVEARVSLDTDFVDSIQNVWVLNPLDSAGDDVVSVFLLSCGGRSAVLHLYVDAKSDVAVKERGEGFDLRYPTITAGLYEECYIQVTTNSIVFTDKCILEGDELLGIFYEGALLGHGSHILNAVIWEDAVLFTITCMEDEFLLSAKPTTSASLTAEDHNVFSLAIRTLAKMPSHITCLATCCIGEKPHVIALASTEDATTVVLQPLDEHSSLVVKFPIEDISHGGTDLGVFLSIAATSNVYYGAIRLVCGTSNGFVAMIEIDMTALKCISLTHDRIGLTTANVQKYSILNQEPHQDSTYFANCDSKLFVIQIKDLEVRGPNKRMPYSSRMIHRVYLTDERDLHYVQPEINSLARFSGRFLQDSVLLVTGSILTIAGLAKHPTAVPRRIPIDGSPSRLLYSQHLRALVVAADVQSQSTLLFIDPETGEDISQPWDGTSDSERDFISGLGRDERIFRLLEWTITKSDNDKPYFIVLCTSGGRLIVVSLSREGTPSRIRYWKQYSFKSEDPIYSVTSFADGLIYCAGSTLYYDYLDVETKGFKPAARHKLQSPAINLIIEGDGRIYVLTSTHSVEILDLKPSKDEFIHTHGDEVTRPALHHRLLHSSISNGVIMPKSSEEPDQAIVHLVSDKHCSLTGLWSVTNTKANTLETVFVAELPKSIMKLRYARSRPLWDPTWENSTASPFMAMPPNSAEYPEVLGLSVDGTVSHFTVLDERAWRFLRFLINLVLQSPAFCPFREVVPYVGEELTEHLAPKTVPKIMMHIDGEILRSVLNNQALESLLQVYNSDEAWSNVLKMFRECLKDMMPQCEDLPAEPIEELIYKAYLILDLFLRPTL